MAYAVIRTGGKQYRVEVGDKIDVEKLPAEAGDSLSIDDVLLVGDGASLSGGGKVTAKVLEQKRAKKVIAFKFKRRKGYHRTVGHRQHLTRLEITAIA